MLIESLTLTNFRSFGPEGEAVRLGTSVTAFVGNNGSGKTAILAALGRLFGVTITQRTVEKSDFHVPADRPSLASGTILSIDCVLGFREPPKAGDLAAIPEVFNHMSISAEGRPPKVRIRLQATWTDDSTPEGTIEEEVRWIHSTDDGFDWAGSPKVGAIDRALVQLVYVPASRNAFAQVTNLLKGRLWRAARWSGGLADTAIAASTSVQRQFDQEAPSKFIARRLAKRWNEVHQGDTDATPALRLIESGLDDLVRQAEFLFLPDGAGQPRHLSDLSDGQRSLFHIALTAATLEIERDALAAPASDAAFDQERLRRTYLTVLAIEEPENSLSPFFLSRIMTQARDLASRPGAQVLVSSHSASILGRVEPEEVRHTRLDPEARRSSVRPLVLPREASDASKYVRLAVKAYPELYFARFVILAEGDSERIVIPSLAQAMGVALDPSFVPVVPLGGRFVRHFWRLLEGLGIPYATLLDLDLGRRHGGAAAIRHAVKELKAIGRHLDRNKSVVEGSVSMADLDSIDDSELLREDQGHAWLKALRRENVYYSSPIDVDYSMLLCFPDRYKVAPRGRRGPRRSPAALTASKRSTLKVGGQPALYGPEYNDDFMWYPYLFLGHSKPETHLSALTRIPSEELAKDAPPELLSLVARVKRALDL